ncbi:glycosyl transferase [Rivularia sp. PCC 7116]|nr:glycosyl transferase [Rivularia sp. PCC 7116]
MFTLANNSQLKKDRIKVSVSLVTFNHEKFIAQAIESVLLQEVDFSYEIIIGEDFSSDRTREIVIDYQKQYPDKIRLILPEENLGCYGQKIFVKTLEASLGEYIALLDGDDYWTTPTKLQQQVDFLDNHPECAICFHDVTTVFEDDADNSRSYNDFEPYQFSDLESILKSNFIPTCSTLYRKGLFNEFPQWYCNIVCGDWVLHVLNARYGKIGYINKSLGVYRVHSNGLFSSMKKIQQLKEAIKCYELLNEYLEFEYNRIIKSEEIYRYLTCLFIYREEGNFIEQQQYINKLIRTFLNHPLVSCTAIFKFIKRNILNKHRLYKWRRKKQKPKLLTHEYSSN